MGKAPAFQFYAADFLIGTVDFSLAELGAYIKLLALSWGKGPVPLDETRRAMWMGVTVKDMRKLWQSVGQKWIETSEGYVNERLEMQRASQASFAAKQAENGRRSGQSRRTKREPNVNGGSTKHEPDLNQPRTKHEPKTNSSVFSLQSSDPPSGKEHPQGGGESAPPPEAVNYGGAYRPVNPHSKPTNLVNGAAIREHGTHAWCSPREGFCVRASQHREFLGKSGRSDEELRAWYAGTVERYTGVGVGEDSFTFWRNEFAAWVGVATSPPAVANTRERRILAASARTADAIARGEL